MANRGVRQCLSDITFYLVTIIAIATLGPLQFGFHLVSASCSQPVVTGITTPLSSSPSPHRNLPRRS